MKTDLFEYDFINYFELNQILMISKLIEAYSENTAMLIEIIIKALIATLICSEFAFFTRFVSLFTSNCCNKVYFDIIELEWCCPCVLS